MSSIALVIKSPKLAADFAKAGQPRENMNRIIRLLSGIKAGTISGAVFVQTSTLDPLAASATLTVASAVAGNAVTIGNVTLTASSTPANENQWEIDGADNTAKAADLAAAINAHSVLGKILTATSSSGVVTVRASQRGLLGNLIPISSNAAPITASAAFLSGGAGGPASSSVQIRG